MFFNNAEDAIVFFLEQNYSLLKMNRRSYRHGFRHHEYAINRHSQEIFPIGRIRQHGNSRERHFNFDQSSDVPTETNETAEPVKNFSLTPTPLPRTEGKKG